MTDEELLEAINRATDLAKKPERDAEEEEEMQGLFKVLPDYVVRSLAELDIRTMELPDDG